MYVERGRVMFSQVCVRLLAGDRGPTCSTTARRSGRLAIQEGKTESNKGKEVCSLEGAIQNAILPRIDNGRLSCYL